MPPVNDNGTYRYFKRKPKVVKGRPLPQMPCWARDYSPGVHCLYCPKPRVVKRMCRNHYLMRRYYAAKIAAARAKRSKGAKDTLPPHQLVLGVADTATGSQKVRLMTAKQARQRMAGHKAGRTTAARPSVGRFDSEMAQRASRKLWTKKYPLKKGIRLGLPALKRKKVSENRAALRIKYAESPTLGITYRVEDAVWVILADVDGQERVISERSALTKLGHLSSRSSFIPTSVRVVRRRKPKAKGGTAVAGTGTQSVTTSEEKPQ